MPFRRCRARTQRRRSVRNLGQRDWWSRLLLMQVAASSNQAQQLPADTPHRGRVRLAADRRIGTSLVVTTRVPGALLALISARAPLVDRGGRDHRRQFVAPWGVSQAEGAISSQ